ncbi:MAG: xanthine dehydrogenase family protein subunit M [Alphaproteobacteria bacterium]|nr:xanthine dehydrogenase family protein subunit M [Alphaproteobacteria bacterium]
MKPPAFEYLAPRSLEQAVAALADGEAKVIAGGQSLVPMLNFRLLAPSLLVDINRIPGLDFIEADDDGGLRIGALTRHYTLETSILVQERFPVLRAAMAHVAHLAIRNRGTIGGSLCHGDPAAELPGLALLLDAQLKTTQRTVAAVDFFESALSTVLADDEILTEIQLPAPTPRTGWGFEEFARRSGDFALAAVGATVSLSGDAVAEARIVVIGAHDTPLRVSAAEALLTDRASIAAAAAAARDAVSPNDDLHASADYRRHLVGVLTRRALTAAWQRAAAPS